MHDKLPFSLKSYAFKGQNLPGKGRNWANANFQLWKFKFSSTRTQHTHTLDKNGSLYDPAGTESWNMQTSLDLMQMNQ